MQLFIYLFTNGIDISAENVRTKHWLSPVWTTMTIFDYGTTPLDGSVTRESSTMDNSSHAKTCLTTTA